MSEWKNRVRRDVRKTEQPYCTGWGIADGLISLISSISKRRKERKTNKNNKN